MRPRRSLSGCSGGFPGQRSCGSRAFEGVAASVSVCNCVTGARGERRGRAHRGGVRKVGGLMDGAAGDRAQGIDLIGNLIRCAAGLCCDLGQEALDMLDAARKPVLDGAEVAAGAGRDLLQQDAGILQASSTSDNSPRSRSLVPMSVSTARAVPSSIATRMASVDCM